MSQTKTDQQRREFLAALNLDPDAPALEQVEQPQRAMAPSMPNGVQWAPEGIDPHTMAISDIVFDPAMVEQFPDLSPRGRRPASDFLFAVYKSYGRNKDRNSLLHRRIGEFLAKEHKRRTQPGGEFVKDKIRLANVLAEHGITEDDLSEFLAYRKERDQ